MKHTLEVWLPYPKVAITQRFGDNANGSYSRDGLKGHTAYDFGAYYDKDGNLAGAYYGAPILNLVADSYCYSRMNEGDKYLNDYQAVFFIVETETGVYEISYGHLSGFVAEVGKTYQVGEIIGKVGNTGTVFTGDREVTEKEKEAGSHAGAHLHGPQVRPVKKVTTRAKGKHYLQTVDGYYKKDGFYFEVIDFDNGYNGCVHPYKPFSTEKLAVDALKADLNIQKTIDTVTEAVPTISSLPPAEQTKLIVSLQKLFAALGKFFLEL